jgi:hypothetical protein
MKMLDLSVGTMVMRLHLMSAVMVTLGFFGFLYLGIVIGMVIFLFTLLGIKWKNINPFRKAHHNHYDWHHKHYDWQHHH